MSISAISVNDEYFHQWRQTSENRKGQKEVKFNYENYPRERFRTIERCLLLDTLSPHQISPLTSSGSYAPFPFSRKLNSLPFFFHLFFSFTLPPQTFLHSCFIEILIVLPGLKANPFSGVVASISTSTPLGNHPFFTATSIHVRTHLSFFLLFLTQFSAISSFSTLFSFFYPRQNTLGLFLSYLLLWIHAQFFLKCFKFFFAFFSNSSC